MAPLVTHIKIHTVQTQSNKRLDAVTALNAKQMKFPFFMYVACIGKPAKRNFIQAISWPNRFLHKSMGVDTSRNRTVEIFLTLQIYICAAVFVIVMNGSSIPI